MSLQDELKFSRESGRTSPNPVSCRGGIGGDVSEESRKLAADNLKLRYELFLMKENAELRTATLISQVIAWSDENLRRYLAARPMLSGLGVSRGGATSPFVPIDKPASTNTNPVMGDTDPGSVSPVARRRYTPTALPDPISPGGHTPADNESYVTGVGDMRTDSSQRRIPRPASPNPLSAFRPIVNQYESNTPGTGGSGGSAFVPYRQQQEMATRGQEPLKQNSDTDRQSPARNVTSPNPTQIDSKTRGIVPSPLSERPVSPSTIGEKLKPNVDKPHPGPVVSPLGRVLSRSPSPDPRGSDNSQTQEQHFENVRRQDDASDKKESSPFLPSLVDPQSENHGDISWEKRHQFETERSQPAMNIDTRGVYSSGITPSPLVASRNESSSPHRSFQADNKQQPAVGDNKKAYSVEFTPSPPNVPRNRSPSPHLRQFQTDNQQQSMSTDNSGVHSANLAPSPSNIPRNSNPNPHRHQIQIENNKQETLFNNRGLQTFRSDQIEPGNREMYSPGLMTSPSADPRNRSPSPHRSFQADNKQQPPVIDNKEAYSVEFTPTPPNIPRNRSPSPHRSFQDDNIQQPPVIDNKGAYSVEFTPSPPNVHRNRSPSPHLRQFQNDNQQQPMDTDNRGVHSADLTPSPSNIPRNSSPNPHRHQIRIENKKQETLNNRGLQTFRSDQSEPGNREMYSSGLMTSPSADTRTRSASPHRSFQADNKQRPVATEYRGVASADLTPSPTNIPKNRSPSPHRHLFQTDNYQQSMSTDNRGVHSADPTPSLPANTDRSPSPHRHQIQTDSNQQTRVIDGRGMQPSPQYGPGGKSPSPHLRTGRHSPPPKYSPKSPSPHTIETANIGTSKDYSPQQKRDPVNVTPTGSYNSQRSNPTIDSVYAHSENQLPDLGNNIIGNTQHSPYGNRNGTTATQNRPESASTLRPNYTDTDMSGGTIHSNNSPKNMDRYLDQLQLEHDQALPRLSPGRAVSVSPSTTRASSPSAYSTVSTAQGRQVAYRLNRTSEESNTSLQSRDIARERLAHNERQYKPNEGFTKTPEFADPTRNQFRSSEGYSSQGVTFAGYDQSNQSIGQSRIGLPIGSSTPMRSNSIPLLARPPIAMSVLHRPIDSIIGYKPVLTDEKRSMLSKLKPTRRLVGEVAFQLDRRILDYVFCKRYPQEQGKRKRRFYGFSLVHIGQMILKEATDAYGKLNAKEELEMRYRLDHIVRSMAPFGYAFKKHTEFSQDMVNKYGLMSLQPDRQTIHDFGLEDPVVLRALLGHLIESKEELHDVLILLDCLYLLAHDDGKAVFLW
ncbi:hypothetical protein ScPMuIL_001938 [Solemya velum]